MEAIEYLIEFHDYHGNINGIDIGVGGDSNTIEKCDITLDRKLKTRENLFRLENDINGLSTASLFLLHVFLLFNQRYVKDSQLFNTTRSRSIYGICNVLNGDLAIQPTRTRKVLHYMIHNPTKQSVDAYHNNINGLKNSSVLRGAVATMKRVPLAQTKYHLTVWYKFLNVILSFRHDKLRHNSNNNTSGGKRGGVDNCDNIRYIKPKFATR